MCVSITGTVSYSMKDQNIGFTNSNVLSKTLLNGYKILPQLLPSSIKEGSKWRHISAREVLNILKVKQKYLIINARLGLPRKVFYQQSP